MPPMSCSASWCGGRWGNADKEAAPVGELERQGNTSGPAGFGCGHLPGFTPRQLMGQEPQGWLYIPATGYGGVSSADGRRQYFAQLRVRWQSLRTPLDAGLPEGAAFRYLLARGGPTRWWKHPAGLNPERAGGALMGCKLIYQTAPPRARGGPPRDHCAPERPSTR